MRQNVQYRLTDHYVIQHLQNLYYSYLKYSYIWYTKILTKNSKRPTLLFGLV